MDQQRAQTLQALEALIHTQRQLLERQRSDIDKLHRLRVDLCARPAQVLANLSNELDDPAFRLSEQADCRLKLPKDIHWSAFEKSDTTPLRSFAHTQVQNQTQRTALPPSHLPANGSGCGPNTTQHLHLQSNGNLSDLQKLVKTARRAIVDPVLDKFAGMSPEPRDLEEEEEERKERRRRERAREEIVKLRGCGLRVRLSSAMVLEGEGVDVDVDVVDDDDGGGGAAIAPMPVPMEVDEGATPAVAVDDAPVSVGPKRVRRKGKQSPPLRAKRLTLLVPPTATRVRRPRKSLHDDDDDDGGLMPPPSRIPTSQTRRKATVSGETTPESAVEFGSASEHDQDQDHSDNDDDDDEEDDDDDSEESPAPQKTRPKSKHSKTRKSKNAKPKLPKPPKAKPETYKQAWSVSEQNLLEQLLEEIQDGERCRWQKISRAMGGRRTPRQVASRVQKYLEKLKKFGVDV